MIITDALASTATAATSTGSFVTSLVPLVPDICGILFFGDKTTTKKNSRITIR